MAVVAEFSKTQFLRLHVNEENGDIDIYMWTGFIYKKNLKKSLKM